MTVSNMHAIIRKRESSGNSGKQHGTHIMCLRRDKGGMVWKQYYSCARIEVERCKHIGSRVETVLETRVIMGEQCGNSAKRRGKNERKYYGNKLVAPEKEQS